MASWEATLALEFTRQRNRTALTRAKHEGPLLVQKPLYPEGGEVCQTIVVHPPAGIAGGDRIDLSIDVGAAAHAQLTTPGAAKWYRSTGKPAEQIVSVAVANAGICEWLPQEAIVFNGARARLATNVSLASDAIFIGWDIVCLGRIASGERFDRGDYRQCFKLVRDGALVWTEQTIVDTQDGFAASPIGLNGCPMFGTFVAAAPVIDDNALAACREVASAQPDAFECAVTRMPHVLVGRCRGYSHEAARLWFNALWMVLRPALCGREAVLPRIWNT